MGHTAGNNHHHNMIDCVTKGKYPPDGKICQQESYHAQQYGEASDSHKVL